MKIQDLYEIFLAHPIITTDSRRCPPDSIFCALKGDNFDGNIYASKALENGCVYAIVDNDMVAPEMDNRYIVVDNVLCTLQELAHYHREHFPGTVIQITGTNGKTTTKELVAAVLSRKYNVLYTEGNLNNHIGVPKTLLRIKPSFHQIAVIETGANHPGEIALLSKITDPDCGLITNIGRAHLEGFGSFDGVIKAKGELYDYLRNKKKGFVFLDYDNPILPTIATGIPSVCYGSPPDATKIVQGEVVSCSPFLSFRWRKGKYGTWHVVTTRLIGMYNLQNVLAAACVGIKFRVNEEDISAALSEYVPKNDRSELRITAKNKLIVDAYNANPSSMSVALENFKNIKHQHKMVILGDMRELGETSREEHRKVISLLQQQNDCENVWLVGKNFQKEKSPYRCFRDVNEVKQALQETPIEGMLILIKGSNATRLYQLPDLL